jgi:hypothetical protein
MRLAGPSTTNGAQVPQVRYRQALQTLSELVRFQRNLPLYDSSKRIDYDLARNLGSAHEENEQGQVTQSGEARPKNPPSYNFHGDCAGHRGP